MAYTTYLDIVQKIYIGYYQRPADPAGLVYWAASLDAAGGNQTTIINAFAASAESQALYGTISSANIGTVVDNIYTALFGRVADTAGKAYYVNGFNAGTFTPGTIVLSVLNGAQGADLLSVNDKLAVANTFTSAINPGLTGRPPFQATYSGAADIAAARAFLATVTWNPATEPTAAEVATFIAANIADPADPIIAAQGKTYTLTAGVDTITGGVGNDTVNGTDTTLTGLDTIDGGGGTDTINLSDVAGGTTWPGVTIKNVEIINLASSAIAKIDTSALSDLTTLNITQSKGADNITAGKNQAVTVLDSAGTVTVAGGSTQTVTTAGGVALTKATGAITVTDTAQANTASTIDGGTSLSLTTTALSTAGATGTITIGSTAAVAPTGAINVVENITGVTTGGTAAGAINIIGGTTVSVTQNVTQPTVTVAGANQTTTQAAVGVTGIANTTGVTVTQTAAQTAAPMVAAVAGVTETDSAVFVALTAGQTLIAGGLTFTAGAAGTTAAQTAAAFANLAKNAIQGSSTLGTYSGTFAGWTTGAVSGTASDTVLVTSTTANSNVGDLAFTGTGTAPALTKTDGSAATAANAGTAGIAVNSVTVTDGALTAAGTITSVTASNYTTVTVNDNALNALSLTNGAGNITIVNNGYAATTNKTLGLTLNNVTGGTLDDSDVYTTLNVTTAGKDSTLANITDTALTALTVAGANKLTLTTSAGMTGLKTVAVSGSAGLSATFAQASMTDINASATSGAVTVTMDATKATYEGGSGADTITLSAANPTKAISLGAGNDKITLANGTSTVNAGITGGDGTDTITMLAADAVTFSGASTFLSKVTGFEVLGLSGATGLQTISIDQMGFNSVTSSASAGTLTLSGYTSGGTLAVTGATAGVGYTVTGATWAAGTADSFNIAVSGVAAGTVTAASVESINISSTAAGSTLTLAATSATGITVTGSGSLALTNTGNTKVTTIDASAMTGALTVSTAGTLAETVTGGAGDDILTALAGTTADVLIGNAGADKLTANAGLCTLTGGVGNDKFVIGTPGANLNTYSTITDASTGDMVQLKNQGTEAFNATKVTLAGTAVFQDYANAVVTAGGDASTDAKIGWFQFGGDTYLVESLHDATLVGQGSFQNGIDVVVKLAGLVNLSSTSLNTDVPPTLLIG